MNLEKKQKLRQKRVWRIRRRVKGTAERPRLCVHFSNRNILAQAIDDRAGRTLVALSTLDKNLRAESCSANTESAAKLGAAFAAKSREAGLTKVVLDRNGRRYHGAVKSFAEAARQGGLEF